MGAAARLAACARRMRRRDGHRDTRDAETQKLASIETVNKCYCELYFDNGGLTNRQARGILHVCDECNDVIEDQLHHSTCSTTDTYRSYHICTLCWRKEHFSNTRFKHKSTHGVKKYVIGTRKSEEKQSTQPGYCSSVNASACIKEKIGDEWQMKQSSICGLLLSNGNYIFYMDDDIQRKLVLTDSDGRQKTAGYLRLPATSWKNISSWIHSDWCTITNFPVKKYASAEGTEPSNDNNQHHYPLNNNNNNNNNSDESPAFPPMLDMATVNKLIEEARLQGFQEGKLQASVA